MLETADRLRQQFAQTRRRSEQLCEPLQLEDYNLQAMPETSPPKWHLAHTTWFYETFILKPFLPGYKPWNPLFEHLFNSYYNGIGEQFPRSKRGLLTRPSLDEVLAYRHAVDQQILSLLGSARHAARESILARVELGLHHEQQHQELFFTDIKYSLSVNPLKPAFISGHPSAPGSNGDSPPSLTWQSFNGGVVEVGHAGSGFYFDNETPKHRVFLEPYRLAQRLTTNREFLAFVDDEAYERPELWLADGWTQVRTGGLGAPLYWFKQDGQWCEYTVWGVKPLDLDAPVSHVSAYEADAFARWSNARLPTEFEWENAAQSLPVEGQFVESGEHHPQPATGEGMQQIFGTLWEWTSSAYSPYPNFTAAEGAIGEYNGKFMCNQLVLRGGSCVSSQSHLRASYRNFFYPPDRWQFTGIRLAGAD